MSRSVCALKVTLVPVARTVPPAFTKTDRDTADSVIATDTTAGWAATTKWSATADLLTPDPTAPLSVSDNTFYCIPLDLSFTYLLIINSRNLYCNTCFKKAI